MHRLIISAPFGNYLNWKGATSTIGTYTYKYRGGVFYRMWRFMRTARYYWRLQSWVNQLGLPNPGMGRLLRDWRATNDALKGKILSIKGLNAEEWRGISDTVMIYMKSCELEAIELNLSCPNVNHKVDLSEIRHTVAILVEKSPFRIIAKLPPIDPLDYAKPLYEELGVKSFHCCNTLPVPCGGMSGKVLKPFSIRAVSQLREKFGNDCDIIGGGGITSVEGIDEYLKAGASRVAIGSMLLNPFNWRKVRHFADRMKVFDDYQACYPPQAVRSSCASSAESNDGASGTVHEPSR